ncbi:MAG: hypothetical protein ACP5SJ_03220 [Candidatus Micrarchaeia archaeon]
MATAEGVLEDLSGMVSRETAMRIASGEIGAGADYSGKASLSPQDSIDVAGLLEFINSRPSVNLNKSLFQPQQAVSDYIVNVKDTLYRVFNLVEYNYGARKGVKRYIVLGKEGKTIRMAVFDNLAKLVDLEAFERGDTVLVRNAALTQNGELKSIKNTFISKIAPSPLPIPSFADLKGNEKNVDAIGKVVEIYPIKYVNRLDGTGQIGVANCTLSDSSSTMRATFWGSSASATASLNVNDIIKIEFCSVRSQGEEKELYVGDSSRVFASKLLASRIRATP